MEPAEYISAILGLVKAFTEAWAFVKKYIADEEVRNTFGLLKAADTVEKKSEAAHKLADLIYRS